MSDITPYEMQAHSLRLENALVIMAADNERLRAEHDRLREALEKIEQSTDPHAAIGTNALRSIVGDIGKIAHAALAKEAG